MMSCKATAAMQYKTVLIVSFGFCSIIDTARTVYRAEPMTESCVCPSVCLSHRVTAVPTCGGFAAERRANTTSGVATLVTTRHTAADASNVMFTAD